jgi:hypothetical protein
LISEQRDFDIAVELHLPPAAGKNAAEAIPGHPIPGNLRGVNNGLFELDSPQYIQPGSSLDLRHQERIIEARVAYCERATHGYRLGLLLACDAERRSEKRTAVDLPGLLRMGDPPVTVAVRVVDLSPSGLGFELPAAVPVGASVSLDLSVGTALGEIRHCVSNLDRYRAGMRTKQFILRAGSERTLVFSGAERGTDQALAQLARSVQERHARYEAMLFSWSAPRKNCGDAKTNAADTAA